MPSAHDSDDEFIREKMWVTRKKGTHLSQSRKAPGESSPLTRDDDDPTKVGQVTLGQIDEDDLDESSVVYVETSAPPKSAAQVALEREIQERISQLIDLAVAAATPHVKKFYNERARPAISARWEKRPRRRRTKEAPPSNEPLSIGALRVAIGDELAEASADYRQRMSSSEAQARLVLAMLLKALSDEQLSQVANADVVLDATFEELERRFTALPSEQATFMIESLLDDPSLIATQLIDFEKLLKLPPTES